MSRHLHEVSVPCRFPKGAYAALSRIALAKGTQVHTLIEQMTLQALESAVVPDPVQPRRGPNPRPSRLSTTVDRKQLLALHDRGMSDVQISAVMGFTRQWVGLNRRGMGLPANSGRNVTPEPEEQP